MTEASLAGDIHTAINKKRKAADIYPFLEVYISRKEYQIREIEQVVERFEKKRMMEEQAYRTMSTIRRMFAGKKPDHHVAVEYIHYVKKPMETVRALRQEIDSAREILARTQPNDVVALSDQMVKELT